MDSAAIAAEARALVEFAKAARVEFGFGWLTDDGGVDADKTLQLWINGRMTHSFAMGHLLGIPGCDELARHGIWALSNQFRDGDNGWYSELTHSGEPTDDSKAVYAQAFVVLGASSAKAAAVAGADELMNAALSIIEKKFWDEEYGMVVDFTNRDASVIDPYRGVNSNMHMVEAFLAAAAATGDDIWLHRATRITERVSREFANHDLRLPEHYNLKWMTILDYNRDEPAHPFRPYGATPGHALEWARLMVHLAAELDQRDQPVPTLIRELPPKLYAQALADGWARNGNPGFVYTTDFAGVPVVESRMHWVTCEAISTAEVLRHSANPEEQEKLQQDIDMFWQYLSDYVIEWPGAWRHELAADNTPAAGTWSGKPDIYHALQTAVIGTIPPNPPFAWALKAIAPER